MTLHHFLAEDGARLAFRDDQIGKGGPVLLCLAGLTRTGRDFDYLLPHLSAARVIRPDYRGRGASEWTGPDSYTIPQESRDALALLDHLGIERAAVIGTSRGGLIGLVLAATVRKRVSGLCLNDVGPVIERRGLERILDYIGRNPAAKTHEEMAARLPEVMQGFSEVSAGRWLKEAQLHYTQSETGLRITYDPALRAAFMAGFDTESPDLWPLFDATAGLPLALIRGANSDLLSRETAEEMLRRRPDMIHADVPGRAHIPFLDEPESLATIQSWIKGL